MKRIISMGICLMLLSVVTFASDKVKQSDYFQRGAFFSVDLSAGNTFNERINTSYGIDMAAGYRFCPQFVVAAGFGGYSYKNATATVSGGELRNNQTTSVPVFLRLRSDIMDSKVSPYVQLDFGYSFVFLYSRDAADKIKYNDQVFIHRVKEMGFDSLDIYENYFRGQYKDKTAQAVDALWNAELSRLKQFTNGRYEYIPMEDVHVQYGKKGLFCNLEFGAAWQVCDKIRMNAGISAGLSQSFYGTCLRTNDNRFLQFGRVDFLPYEKQENKVYVRTLGTPDLKDSFELDLMVKIGFTF
jgi:hypothetical protein